MEKFKYAQLKKVKQKLNEFTLKLKLKLNQSIN